MKSWKNFLLTTISALFLSSCSQETVSLAINNIEDTSEEALVANLESKTRENKYLCLTIPNGAGNELVKIINLKTNETVTLPIPGNVQGMSSNLENDLLYVNAKSGETFSLYKIEVKTKQVSRILSFSQLGIKPTYFLVNGNNVFVAGKRSGVGSFYGNDLIKSEWFAVANNISPGRIELGFNENTYHVVSYDDELVTRTIVDVVKKQIIARRAIQHDIPFGNNVFIPSPHGLYVYVLHQLQDSFIPYAFNIKQGVFNKFDPVKTNGGLLYSAIVSNNGKDLFTNVNREIYHYKLLGDKLLTLPKVVLNLPESRNMVMAANNRTLYVTHESGVNLSVVSFSNDNNYTISTMYVGGSTNQIYLF